jgi:ATP/maltotriose-dependent transcriptional regulator MalT
VQGVFDRHGLVATLDRAPGKRVTIISAPAGSGKTSLLRAERMDPPELAEARAWWTRLSRFVISSYAWNRSCS